MAEPLSHRLMRLQHALSRGGGRIPVGGVEAVSPGRGWGIGTQQALGLPSTDPRLQPATRASLFTRLRVSLRSSQGQGIRGRLMERAQAPFR